MKIRSGCEGGGKGALVQKELSATLATHQDQTIFEKTENPCYPINTMLATRDKALGRGTGLGIGNAGDPQFTITKGHEHAVAYSFDSLASNSMKSANPNSGCHETNTGRTLDCGYPDPSKNQGGIAIVQKNPEAQYADNELQAAFELKNTVLNDQGGGKMSVTYGVAGTLRAQEHGHPPITFDKTGGIEQDAESHCD